MEFLANLHPQVVHFPIAFLIIYAVLEIVGVVSKKEFFTKTAYLFLFLGVLGALVAVLTGNQAESIAHQWEKAGAIINFHAIGEHEDYANITLWYFFGVLILRTFFVVKKRLTINAKYLFIVLALVGTYFLYETGLHGGKLVYRYGIGTDLKKMEITK